MTRFAETLQDYLNQVLPAMYRRGYHLRLAKGGPDYPHLPEQSLLVHVLNGVFGLVRLLDWLEEVRIPLPGLDEAMLRRVLALYTVHDVHKLGDFERLGPSEFSIPRTRLAEEWEALGLGSFAAPVDEHLLRAANVSKLSRHQGDLLLAGPGAGRDWLLVRIADAVASSTCAREAASSLGGYIKLLAPEVATGWRLYWHELRDVRGVLTNLIHAAVAEEVRPLGFYPLLFFPTGTLYVGPKEQRGFHRSAFLDALADRVLRCAVPPEDLQKSAAEDGLRPYPRCDFQPYVYTFARIELLLGIILEETQRKKPDPKEVLKDIAKIENKIEKKKDAPKGLVGNFEHRFQVSRGESKGFNERWSLVRRYLLYLDAILRTLAPTLDRIGWYESTFELPPNVTSALREDLRLFEIGGVGKHVIVPAYHFLKGSTFAARRAEATDVPEVLQRLHERVLAHLPHGELEAGRRTVVEQLGFGPDLREYLGEHLVLSWTPDARPAHDPLRHYAVPKRKGHSKRLCSLCNRTSEHVQELRTDVLGDFGQVFSNRVLPSRKAERNRPWCPVCHLEFMLRRRAGLSLPAGASYRIYLYVLPTYSFTPEHAAVLGRLLHPLQLVTSLPVRDYGEASPGIPRLWLERRALDPDWMDRVVQVLEREADRIARGGPFGDRLLTTGAFTQPNYLLVPWERSVREGQRDDARIPTRTEAWAKATFAAAVIAALTGSRVYVTERPFLPLSDPDALKPTVTLDSPPPVVAKLLGNEQDPKLRPQTESISLFGREAGGRSGLERALDLCAALWQVTCDVRRAGGPPTKDKHVAERLGVLVTEPLAGARFYKEYARLNDGASPPPPLARACEVLLDHLGGEEMDLVSRIAEKTLEIRLPYREFGRGKFHNREFGRGKFHSYELVFREAMSAIREGLTQIPELRRLALTGGEPSLESLTELKLCAVGRVQKAMERRRAQRSRDVIQPWGGDLNAKVSELIDLIVDEVFLREAGGSISRFVQRENKLADGVYCYIDRVLGQKWEEYGRSKSERQAQAGVEV
ncbi:MAG: type I-D CRISPR-associated protein Cas10d/Csc3 [Clostridiales bacterium]|nr:type I-D CRISPR-associated protein Cas10d/Csc3 [Clostridiales bacterium]